MPQSTVHGSLLMQVYLFASASNYVININMATPVAGLEAVNTHLHNNIMLTKTCNLLIFNQLSYNYLTPAVTLMASVFSGIQ